MGVLKYPTCDLDLAPLATQGYPMDDISPSDLKSILHSKRANIYYLEHCRVLVNGGRVEYVTDEGRSSLYWNIPIANTTTLLLGTGTSVTQAAMRELAKAGVLVGFCGGGGTPLFSANEMDFEVSWFSPQSEYRPTEYIQHWVKFWFNEDRRVDAARRLQLARLDYVSRAWLDSRTLLDAGFGSVATPINDLLLNARASLSGTNNVNDLLLLEAKLTKEFYKLAVRATGYDQEFTRAKNGTGTDPANRFLDHGNYLAYGLGASATWVLGLPHGLSILHGKTRRGGLVFDAADLIKDAIVLPQAFISAMAGHDEQEFRQSCIEGFARAEALDFIIDTLKAIALKMGSEAS